MEKTRITEVKIYLASKNFTIRINKVLTVGRSSGDIILEDDQELSGTHCELIPKTLILGIKDLGSANGVYVNGTRIPPHTEVIVNNGDQVVFGSQRFIFLNSEEELLEKFPKPDRRRNARPKHLFSPVNILNFHSVPMEWKGLYLLAFLLTIISFARNAQFTYALPEYLQFMPRLYHEQVSLSAFTTLVWVWILCLIHSFVFQNYLNRHIIRKIVAFVSFVVVLCTTVDLKNGPLSHIKVYVEGREEILKGDAGEKSILRLRKMIDAEARIKSSYPIIVSQLEGENKLALEKDFKKLMRLRKPF